MESKRLILLTPIIYEKIQCGMKILVLQTVFCLTRYNNINLLTNVFVNNYLVLQWLVIFGHEEKRG